MGIGGGESDKAIQVPHAKLGHMSTHSHKDTDDVAAACSFVSQGLAIRFLSERHRRAGIAEGIRA